MKETYTTNNNPFDWRGRMGRLPFFLYNTLYYILTVVSILFLCPVTLNTYSQPILRQNTSQLELILLNSPKTEVVVYICIIFALAFLTFILYKKRLLDLSGKSDFSLRNSFFLAGAVACLIIQMNLFVKGDSKLATFLFAGYMVIYLFLVFKKGAPMDCETQKEEPSAE